MLIAEVLIDGVFVAALLAALACLTYLLYATMLECRLLRTQRCPEHVAAGPGVSSPAACPRERARVRWHRSPGTPAVPLGKH